MSNKNAPLQGINVLDFIESKFPSATQILSDYGANVIKVNHAREPIRYLSPKVVQMLVWKYSIVKKSIAIDLKNPDGLGIIKNYFYIQISYVKIFVVVL